VKPGTVAQTLAVLAAGRQQCKSTIRDQLQILSRLAHRKTWRKTKMWTVWPKRLINGTTNSGRKKDGWPSNIQDTKGLGLRRPHFTCCADKGAGTRKTVILVALAKAWLARIHPRGRSSPEQPPAVLCVS